MPIFRHSTTFEIVQTAPHRGDLFAQTGVANNGNFAICDRSDYVKQIKFDPASQTTNTTVTITSGASVSDLTITLPANSGTLATGSFKTIQTDLGTSPVATGPTDTLTFTSGDGSITVTGNFVTDSVDLRAVSGSGGINRLTGDVTTSTGVGSQAATVAFVGTSSAANVHSAELLANAATNTNTVSTIVKRDSSGNFSAGTISAAITGNVTGNVTGNLTGNVTGNTSGTAATFTGNLTGDVTSTGMSTSIAGLALTKLLNFGNTLAIPLVMVPAGSGSAQTDSTGSLVDVTSMSFPIAVNEAWCFFFWIQHGCNNTGGVDYAINGPTGAVYRALAQGASSGITAQTSAVMSVLNTATGVSFNTVNSQGGRAMISGKIVADATHAGTVALRFCAHTSTQTATFYAESFGVAVRVA